MAIYENLITAQPYPRHRSGRKAGHIQERHPYISAALLLILLFSHTFLFAQVLPEFNARYAIEKFGIKVAEAHYQLSYTDTGYKFTQNSKLIGFASMFRDDTISAVSYVDQAGNELLLKKHRYIQTGKEQNRNEDFTIQWDTSSKPAKGKIQGTVRSKAINLETDTAIWEALSFQIPLMIEASVNKKDYPYQAILKGEIDTYNFVLTSTKKISFSGNEYLVLHMVRTDPHKDRQLHIWLAPELNNIPVIVENYRDGKIHSRMQLESIQFNNNEAINDTDDDNDF